MQEVIIKCDGSYYDNGKSGCAFVVIIKDEDRVIYQECWKPVFNNPSNNRCEMEALLRALLFLKSNQGYKAIIYLDSKTVLDGVLGIGRRLANRDIWESIENVFPCVREQIVDVLYLNTDEMKETDRLARRAANALFLKEGGDWLL